eukprot:TRINITY_DN3617_c0_g1_i1.p1 TRINITY_DN3617_c0_g1~~TRINITY_DN3617_c0_g1_i1.p1  ORF type:complete len:166 (-),score=15.70 TRINITY_DN3617_c0_g1_i1:215-712(-)
MKDVDNQSISMPESIAQPPADSTSSCLRFIATALGSIPPNANSGRIWVGLASTILPAKHLLQHPALSKVPKNFKHPMHVGRLGAQEDLLTSLFISTPSADFLTGDAGGCSCCETRDLLRDNMQGLSGAPFNLGIPQRIRENSTGQRNEARLRWCDVSGWRILDAT